jgi:hypothetical protein
MNSCAKSTEAARLLWEDRKALPTPVELIDSNKPNNRSPHVLEVASGLTSIKQLRQQRITWHRIRNLTLYSQQLTIPLRLPEIVKTIQEPASRGWCLTISSSWTWKIRGIHLFPTTMEEVTLGILAMVAILGRRDQVRMSIMLSIQATMINQEV